MALIFALVSGVHHRKNDIFSIDKIKAELTGNPLANWVRNDVPPTFFKKTNNVAVVKALADMNSWVNANPQFTPEARAEFAASADGWLVAYAKIGGQVVVTHEVLEPRARKKVKIPNVCIEFGVDCVNTFEMLIALGVRFVRSTKR